MRFFVVTTHTDSDNHNTHHACLTRTKADIKYNSERKSLAENDSISLTYYDVKLVSDTVIKLLENKVFYTNTKTLKKNFGWDNIIPSASPK